MPEHVHKWRYGLAGFGDEYFRCNDRKGIDEGCQAVLTLDEVEAILNATMNDAYADKNTKARAIMEKFIFKVDEGLARSKETYAEMKAWLEEA